MSLFVTMCIPTRHVLAEAVIERKQKKDSSSNAPRLSNLALHTRKAGPSFGRICAVCPGGHSTTAACLLFLPFCNFSMSVVLMWWCVGAVSRWCTRCRVTRMRRSALLCESCKQRRKSVTFQVTPMMSKNGIPSKRHRQGPCRLSGGIERQDIGFA